MPESDAILPYATALRRPPHSLSVILYLWGIPSVLVGLQMTIAAWEDFSMRRDFIGATMAIAIGAAFYGWAIYTFIVAQKIRSDFGTLRRASRIAMVVECLLWLLNIWFIVYISTHSVEDTSPVPCAIFTLPIPICATLTRIFLRRVARQFPVANCD